MSRFNIYRRKVLAFLGSGAALSAILPSILVADTGQDSKINKTKRSGKMEKKSIQNQNTTQSANWLAPLGDYITSSQIAPLPEDIRELARRHILDTLASIVACRNLESAQLSRNFAREHGQGATAAPILGTQERSTLLEAILASAMTAHAAEINDFCPSAYVQPSAAIIPATLCLGDMRNVTGEQFLRAMIVGYEISCRMPKALGIRNLYTSMLACHSVGPVFGTAAAVASLINLPKEKMEHMFSYCVEQASGSWQWMRDVDHIEKAYVFGGMPATRGTEAALFTEAGFTGIGDPFKGDPGWLNSKIFKNEKSDFKPDYLIEDLGKRFELPLVGYKRYPVGGPTQTSIELMLQFIKEIDRHKVQKVRIDMPGGRTDTFANAEMPALNLPYLCAIILADGKLDFEAAQSRKRFLTDTKIHKFMPNVQVVHDPSQEETPRVESARVTLTMNDGSKVEKYLHHVKGFPAHPFGREEVLEKALELMTPILGEKRSQTVCDTIWEIEKLDSVKKLVELIAT